jgi:hypothetical protein
MRCHYENIKGVGKVLIPGCMAVAVSGDIDRCTCMPTTIRQFETPKYKKEVERLKGIIRRLEEENDYYADILERNQIKNDFEREKSS